MNWAAQRWGWDRMISALVGLIASAFLIAGLWLASLAIVAAYFLGGLSFALYADARDEAEAVS